MSLLIVSQDLMFTSRADGVARNLGQQGITAGNFNTATEALHSTDDLQIILIDLQLPGFDIVEFVAAARKLVGKELLIVACGPHVHEQKLNEARQAGCDRVVTKGQFDREAPAILTV